MFFLRAIAGVLAAASVSGSLAQPLSVTTFAGSGTRGFADGPALTARLADPSGVTVDGATNIYVADTYSNIIRLITPDATGTNWAIRTIAGSPGTAGDIDGTNNSARFNQPLALTIDSALNLYVADSANNQVRQLHRDATGTNWIVSTIAGAPDASPGSADGTNLNAQFNQPSGLAAGAPGILWVADRGNNTIRKMTRDSTGTNWVVTTFAGAAGQSGFLDATSGLARFSSPNSIALDTGGNLYVADGGNNAIRMITPAGAVATLAGGHAGPADGLGTNAQFDFPCGIAVDAATNIYVSDFYNFCVRRVSRISNSWVVSTVAGQPQVAGASDGVATLARFRFFNARQNPNGLAIDHGGDIFICDTENSEIRRATVYEGLLFTVLPQNEAVVAGSAITFSATAVGALPITYQWYKNNQLIAGATNATLTLSNVQTNQAASYRVRVMNSSGVSNSPVAFLTVIPPLAVSTVAGLGAVGAQDGLGPAARFNNPSGVAIDNAGNAIVADTFNDTIRKVSPAGIVTTIAGAAEIPGSADGVGTNARFASPFGVAADVWSNIYVADTLNQTIRRISPGNNVNTIAGSPGVSGFRDGPAQTALFHDPYGVAADSTGDIYIADTLNNSIRVLAHGYVTTLAGNGASGALNAVGTNAEFNEPLGLAIDSAGNLFVADYGNDLIREINTNGVVSTVAGLPGQPGAANGDNSIAQFNLPSGVAVDAQENLYVADLANHDIRQLILGAPGVWSINTLAGLPQAFGDSDGTATGATFHNPTGLALDNLGNVYVADSSNNLVRTVTPGGIVSTLAGATGSAGSADGLFPSSRLDGARGVCVDSTGLVYIADTVNNTVRELSTNGALSTIAGLPGPGGSSDGLGGAARFSQPAGLAVDVKATVYVADFQNSTIRALAQDPGSGQWSTTTLAGNPGVAGYANGTNGVALFNGPSAVAVDAADNLYVADYSNHVIRLISQNQSIVSLYAGNPGHAGYLDGANAFFNFPAALALGPSNSLFVADSQNQLIRCVATNGMVSTIAGTYFVTGSADGNGTSASFNNPQGLAFDASGNLFVADTGNNVIREILPGGDVLTVAALPGRRGSLDGVAGAAQFNGPVGIAVAPSGMIYIADTFNNTVRSAVPYFGQPLVLTPPFSQAVPLGAPVTFPATVAGQTPLSFQWLDNASPISGATSPVLTIPAAQYADDGNYQLQVNNSFGETTSIAATLTVNPSPQIFSQPASQIVAPGAAVSFTVTAFGDAPLNYQWTFDGQPLPGANSATLAIPNTQAANAGTYQALVSNGSGNVSSLLATLTLGAAPQLLSGPSNVIGQCGSNVAFTAQAAGTAPLNYQWFSDGTPIALATEPFYAAGNLVDGQTPTFWVVVSNAFGIATSSIATVQVTDTLGPVITLLGAADTNIVVGSAYVDPGATANDLCAGPTAVATNGSVNTSVVGTYTLAYISADPSGNHTTNNRSVHVVPAFPVIVTPPPNATNYPGVAQTLSVAVTGSTPFTFQWFKNGAPLINGARVSGVGSQTLTINPLQPSDAGSYTVAVTNSSGHALSQPGVLTIAAAGSPIAVAGFNRDVIVENTAVGDNTANYAQIFDPTSPSSPYCFYAAGLAATSIYGTSPTNLGLTSSGLYVSAVDDATAFQLAPYTENNVLYLTVSEPTGTLTLSDATNFGSLSILATSADGGGSGSCVLNFADGSSSPPLDFDAFDWQATSVPGAVTHFGQLFFGNFSGGFFSYNFTNNVPNLYQTTFNLSALGLSSQAIASVTFTKANPGSATVTGIFALSGTSIASPPPLKLQSPALASGALSFTLQTVAGQSYTLQASTNPVPGSWRPFSNFIGTGGAQQFNVPLTNPPQFFRLAEP